MNLKPHIPLIISTSILATIQIIMIDNMAIAVNHKTQGFEVKKVILEDHDYFVSFGYGGYASVTHCGSCTNRVHDAVLPSVFTPSYESSPNREWYLGSWSGSNAPWKNLSNGVWQSRKSNVNYLITPNSDVNPR